MRNRPTPTPTYLPPDSRSPAQHPEAPPQLAPGFGSTLYDLIGRHRLPDGTPWTPAYLASLLGVSKEEVLTWLAGTHPDPETLARIGGALMVDGPALLRGEIQPPTMSPSDHTTSEGR